MHYLFSAYLTHNFRRVQFYTLRAPYKRFQFNRDEFCAGPAPYLPIFRYIPNRAKTEATNSHWVEASQISTPRYPNPAKTTAATAPPTKTLDAVATSFLVICITFSRTKLIENIPLILNIPFIHLRQHLNTSFINKLEYHILKINY